LWRRGSELKKHKEVFSELKKFMKEESLEKSASIRKLLSDGLQKWKVEKALRSFEDRKVTFLKAAEMSGMTVWDFADAVREKGIVWIKSQKFIQQDMDDALR